MDICVVGSGYVGLVVGACLADLGHRVVCVDNDLSKIEALHKGQLPIYEPGLSDIVLRNVHEGRLLFSADGPGAVQKVDVVFIAVGTPSLDDGRADLGGVFEVAEMVGRNAIQPTTVAIKSTVPVGTADKVREVLARVSTLPHEVVNNPEFLKEGAAIDDFMRPDRIIVGCQSEAARHTMEHLYKPLLRTSKPILFMDNRSAEMSKYAANAFLATRISFINDLAILCEKVGADVDAVRQGAGTDSRIGLRFFFPGAGYGGSCFPKDVKALMQTAAEAGHQLRIVEAADAVNDDQKKLLAAKVVERFGSDLGGRRFAVWGLAFKPGTDDMREAPSLVIIESLLRGGATVVAYDPVAMHEALRHLGGRVTLAESQLEALDGADALLVVTDWNEFRSPDVAELRHRLKTPVVFDGRNLWDPSEMALAGIEYHCIGRPLVELA
jgi:UDPglucose 6-dehydrogenase